MAADLSRASRRGLAPLVAGFALALGVWMATAAMATAHAELVSSDPPAGGSLGAAPAHLTLRFSEAVDVTRSSITLVRPNGTPVGVTALAHDGADDRSLVTEAVGAGAEARGPVSVEWRSVSTDDGHVVTGQLPLILAGSGAASLAAPALGAPAPGPGPASGASGERAGVAGVFAAVRTISYLAIALLCGGLAFLVIVWPEGGDVRASRTVLYGAWGAGMLSAVLGIGLEGATVAQRPMGAIFSPSLLGTVLTTKFGRVWAGRGLLFLVALPVLWALGTQGAAAVRSPGWRLAAGVVALGLLRTPGLIGHPSEAPHAVLGSTADLIHLTGVALWIGGLAFLCLVVLPRRRPDELTKILPRFSKVAAWSVLAIVVAGTFMSWQLIGSFHALLSSPFGHVLLIKLGAFMVVLAAAVASRRFVRRRLDGVVDLGRGAATVRPFVVSVGAEAVLAVAVISLASVLVNTSPIR